MNSNEKQKIIRNILTFIQGFIFIPSIVLEHLSKEKMGVIRYLVFKKQTYQKTFFGSYYINLYKCILIAGSAVCVILFIYNCCKTRDVKLIKSISVAIALNLTGIVFIFNKHIELLNAYHFFLISIFIIIILQYIKLLIQYLVKKSI